MAKLEFSSISRTDKFLLVVAILVVLLFSGFSWYMAASPRAGNNTTVGTQILWATPNYDQDHSKETTPDEDSQDSSSDDDSGRSSYGDFYGSRDDSGSSYGDFYGSDSGSESSYGDFYDSGSDSGGDWGDSGDWGDGGDGGDGGDW